MLIPIALLGTALHMPLAIMAYTAGRKMGVDKEGDESTVATVAIVAGFGGILLSYPAIGCLVWFYTGSFLKGSCAVATTALSGCLLYTSPSPRDRTRSRMPSSA